MDDSSIQWLHEKKQREWKGNRLPPGGMRMGGKSGKTCSVKHAGVVRVIKAGQGTVTEAALQGACTNLSSRHPYELHPAKQEVGPVPPGSHREVS